MEFQVGRFTCEISRRDNGQIERKWSPWRPTYLSRSERAQYRAGLAAFELAERLNTLGEPPPQFHPSTPFDKRSGAQEPTGRSDAP